MNRNLQNAIQKQKKSTQKHVPKIYGVLGIPLGGSKLVEVPTRNSYVYVRLRNNQSEVIQAFNNQVAPAYNLPVIVERQGNRYTVIGVDTQRYENNWTSFAPFLPRHGNTHSFDTESGGGGDIVWTYSKQFMPNLVVPSGTNGGPSVFIAPHTLFVEGSTWRYAGNTGTPSLLPYKPSMPTGATLVLVYMDSTTGNPGLLVASGTYVPNTLTGTSQLVSYFPTNFSSTTQIPLAIVRMVSGTASIGWDNIYDVRQFIRAAPTGSAGISNISIQDEGVPQGTATTLNVVGTVADISVSGSVARLFITGSTGGSSFTGISGSVVLTDDVGALTTNSQFKWRLIGGKLALWFGAGTADPATFAGTMGYQLFDTHLDIVGAGTGAGDRTVRIYDNLRVNSHLQMNSFQILGVGLQSSWIYMDGTGTAVTPSQAPEQFTITGSDYLLGINGTTVASMRTKVSTIAAGLVYTDVLGTFLNNVSSPATGTFWSCPYKPTADAITNNFIWPEGGILSHLSFRKSSTQPASGSLVVTLYVNGVATALSVTVPAGNAGAGTFEDNTDNVILNAGDQVRWAFQNNATTTGCQMSGISMVLHKRAEA